VKNFPTSFTNSGLTLHCTCEYKHVVGSDPSKQTINALVYTFSKLWKKVKKKEHFLKSSLCSSWLEKEITTNASTHEGISITSSETVSPPIHRLAS
jgi:hypothetical protein